ncbi:MAG TPA: alpha/beta hydrolase, partial [Burkholderiaceae bacterium]|nr:alpha/beta hydrolase [Burkholderiaceae bacterium]
MPFIEVNGARLFYEVYGTERSQAIPVVLIHGAPSTGRADWGTVAPLLASHYRVFVPDCRGHGQSSNPGGSYSFREMAADVAALVQALGYNRAHILGHSNGGNIALVTLLEHPEVVQSAVLQAANAYVSQDLIEREPAVFDPERVERENPAWIEEMTALHGGTHGPDYWRQLLEITLHEIITQPNYTPEDLRLVRRPTLVIQGVNDAVNAPARHAQFIAGHIPEAELWTPEETGHSVHEERPCEWIERVSDFLERRGDELNDRLYRLGRQRYKDRRETIFNLRATRSEAVSGGQKIKLTGEVLTHEQLQAAHTSLETSQTGETEDKVRVLLREQTPWGLVKRGVTDL